MDECGVFAIEHHTASNPETTDSDMSREGVTIAGHAGLVRQYLASPGGLLRLLHAQNIRRLPPRGSTLAQRFVVEPVVGPGSQGTHEGSGTLATTALCRVWMHGAGGQRGWRSDRRGDQRRKDVRQLARLKHDCEMLARWATPRMRVVVTGSNGLLGSALVPLLVAAGHEVTRLVRSKVEGTSVDALGTRSVFWQPMGQGAGALDPSVLDGVDVVIHLAGEPVGGQRWTARTLAAIRDSRVESTKLLARTMQQLRSVPKVWVCASGIHAYGDRGSEELTERSDIGSGYLAEVVRDWEAAAGPASDVGVRTAQVRWGLVLGRRAGALATMLPLFRLGLGCVPSPGTQWWPWVSLDDAIGQALAVLARSELSGPINGVAPLPTTARDFCRAVARGVDRPLLARVPRWMLRLVFGGQEEAICTSTRAMPEKLRQAGFVWQHATLEEALAWELG